MIIESTVAGIPCLIQIDRCFMQKPLGRMADNDLDCYGYSEIEFTVLDRNGRPAPWLERKLTVKDTSRIEIQILEGEST
jgi:hypothetical protein